MWGSTATPPVITSLDVVQGDLGGGELVPINGTNFSGASDVTFDGVSAAFVVMSPTLILAIAPSGTAGAKDVVVTTGSGTSTGGTGAFTYWDPSLLTLSLFTERLGFALGEYDSIGSFPSIWSARASAGLSAGRTLRQALTPGASPLEDVKEPATDGVNHYLVSDVGFVDTDVWTDAAGTLIVGGIAESAAATAGSAADAGWLVDDGGGTYFSSYFSLDGFGVSFYNGAWVDLQAAASPFSAIVGQFKWSAGDGHIRVGSSAFSTTVGGFTLGGLTGAAVALGKNYAGTAFSKSRFRFCICSQTELSDANCDKVVTWGRNRHAMANGGRPELWYMSSDVVHTTPKRVRIFGKNLGDVTDVRFGLSSGTLQGIFGTMPLLDGAQKLELDGTLDDYFDATAYSGWALVNMKKARTKDATHYVNDTLFSNAASTVFYIVVKADRKVYVVHYDGVGEQVVSADLPAFGDWALVQFKYDGTDVKMRVLSAGAATSWSSTPAASLDAGGLADTMRLGTDYTTAYNMFGLVAEMGLIDSTLSDANMDNVAAYLNMRHGLTLGGITPSIFDPASLALTGWWRTNTYAWGTWTGVASAGTSGTRNMTEATVRPAPTDVVDVLPPVKAAGTYTLSVKNGAGWGTLVDSVEYYNALARSSLLTHRVGDVPSRTVLGGEVTLLEGTGTGADVSRNWTGPGAAPWATGASAPTLFAADPDFGGEDSMGNAPTEVRNVTSDAYVAPITTPVTVYQWLKAFDGALYLPINNGGSAIDAFSFYGSAGLGSWSATTDGTALSIDGIPGTHVFAAVFDGASSLAFSDRFFVGSVGNTGAGSEQSIGFGNFPADGSHWKLAARMVFNGRDDTATRRRMTRWGANFFQVPAAA